MRIDPKFVELTADVLELFFYNWSSSEMLSLKALQLETLVGDNITWN